MDRLGISLAVLALAPAAWLVGSLLLGADYVLSLGLMVAGLGLSAWAFPARRRVLAGVGFTVAAIGVALFYEFDLFTTPPQRAGGVVLLGLMVCAVAAWADTLRGLAVGCSVVAVGCGLWVKADWWDWHWEAGNLIGLGGAVWSAIEAWRHD